MSARKPRERKPYASGTKVTAERSREEIRGLLHRIHATRIVHGSEPGREVIAFEAYERRVLVHRVKSKVITVEEGIAEFEEEFLNEIVLANGQTVGEHLRPQLKTIYERREMPALLPGAEDR